MLRTLVTALAVIALAAPGAHAALKKYYVQNTSIQWSPDQSPPFTVFQPTNIPPGSRPFDGTFLIPRGSQAVIDDDGGGSPILKRLELTNDSTSTNILPSLGGFLFVSDTGIRRMSGEFTGTGSTETSIAWGVVTGWTVTGATWCHSAPSYICILANGRVDLETVDLKLPSAFYDLGTWTFHGTGWTAKPFVHVRTKSTGGGADINNNMFILKGVELHEGTIPALPVLGIVVLGGSVLAAAAASLRRRSR